MATVLRTTLLLGLMLAGCERPAPEPPPTPGTVRQKVTTAAGNTYDGEMRDGRRHGYGTLVIMRQGIPGGTYRGMFENGQAHGPATVTFHESAEVFQVVAERGCVQVGSAWMAIGRRAAECPKW